MIKRFVLGTLAGMAVAFVVGVVVFVGLSLYSYPTLYSYHDHAGYQSGEMWVLIKVFVPAILCGSSVAVRVVATRRIAVGLIFGLVSVIIVGIFIFPKSPISTLQVVVVVVVSGLAGILGGRLAGAPKDAL
jgi:hypothetical protein